MNENRETFYTDTDGGLLYEVSAGVTDQQPVITPPTKEERIQFGSSNCIKFGEDNSFPDNLIEKAKKSTIIPSTLNRLASFIYGGGIVFGTVETDANGKEKFLPLEDEEKIKMIRQALRKANADNYVFQSALYYAWFKSVLPELKLSKDGKSINAVFATNPKKLRWKVPSQSGEIDGAYLSSEWSSELQVKSGLKEKTIIPIPVLNQRVYDPAGVLKEKVKADKAKKKSYIYRLDVADVEGEYYNSPDWYGVELSKWLDFSLAIPKFKNQMMENQMAIKYIIYVDTRYWETKYGKDKWDKKTPDEKRSAKQDELKAFLKNMKGTDGAGGSILSQKMFDAASKTEIKLWEVVAIDDKLKDGTWIIDSSEASSHILYSIGMDPSITGAGPGKNFGSGSGSDKRTATNILISSLRHVQDLILKPFDLMRDYNGWDWDIVFRMRNSIQTTLDQGSSAKESK